jgi:pyruvate dehydrogenase complex dehydrogenase (E1) component
MEQVKQTAIDWFEYQLKDNLGNIVINQNWQLLEGLIEQAKEMEKQRLEQFYNHGQWAIIEHGHGDTFEDYYNKTFKSE